jgi:hypothetical protein
MAHLAEVPAPRAVPGSAEEGAAAALCGYPALPAYGARVADAGACETALAACMTGLLPRLEAALCAAVGGGGGGGDGGGAAAAAKAGWGAAATPAEAKEEVAVAAKLLKLALGGKGDVLPQPLPSADYYLSLLRDAALKGVEVGMPDVMEKALAVAGGGADTVTKLAAIVDALKDDPQKRTLALPFSVPRAGGGGGGAPAAQLPVVLGTWPPEAVPPGVAALLQSPEGLPSSFGVVLQVMMAWAANHAACGVAIGGDGIPANSVEGGPRHGKLGGRLWPSPEARAEQFARIFAALAPGSGGGGGGGGGGAAVLEAPAPQLLLLDKEMFAEALRAAAAAGAGEGAAGGGRGEGAAPAGAGGGGGATLLRKRLVDVTDLVLKLAAARLQVHPPQPTWAPRFLALITVRREGARRSVSAQLIIQFAHPSTPGEICLATRVWGALDGLLEELARAAWIGCEGALSGAPQAYGRSVFAAMAKAAARATRAIAGTRATDTNAGALHAVFADWDDVLAALAAHAGGDELVAANAAAASAASELALAKGGAKEARRAPVCA